MTYEEFLEMLSQEVLKADPEVVATVILAITGMAIAIAIVSFVGYLMTAIGSAKMFKKAGERGWKAFIPVISDYTRFKIAWNTKSFWISALAMVIMNVLPLFGNGIVLSLIALVAAIVALVYAIKLYCKLGKVFGKGVGTGVLLFFFPFVMSLVLGFGKAEYIGSLRSKIESDAAAEKA